MLQYVDAEVKQGINVLTVRPAVSNPTMMRMRLGFDDGFDDPPHPPSRS